MDKLFLKHPLVQQVRALHETAVRKQSLQCLIEGVREIEVAYNNHVELQAIICCEPVSESIQQWVATIGVCSYTCPLYVFEKIAYRKHGVIALAKTPSTLLSDVKVHQDAIYIVAESFEKPGNLGALLRSADACGVEAVFVTDPVIDLYHPNVIRASLGTLFSLKVLHMPAHLLLPFFHTHAIEVVGLTPEAKLFWDEVNLCQPTALVCGCEKQGLSNTWKSQAHHLIRLPMMGKADSLNVTMAATAVLYEAVRQKHHLRR